MLPLRSCITCVDSLRNTTSCNSNSSSRIPIGRSFVKPDIFRITMSKTVSFIDKKEEEEEEEKQISKEIIGNSVETQTIEVADKVAIKNPPRPVTEPIVAIPSSILLRNRPILLSGEYFFNWVEGEEEFKKLIENCQLAIDHNIDPQRISEGSSGSYYVKDTSGAIVGVFKPMDEEPYGQLNPKWIKWLHRSCCPCFFGRSFLMPNSGYISEAAASLLDRFLGLNMVPRTHVAQLSSRVFYFSWLENIRIMRERRKDPAYPYPTKIGSFQLFVEGFESSSVALAKMDSLRPLDYETRNTFQSEFEKMTILDYAMRNTDRSMNNWLIHFSRVPIKQTDSSVVELPERSNTIKLDVEGAKEIKKTSRLNASCTHLESILQDQRKSQTRVKIACIDNGLAFPFKHPHEVRSYPYSWATLSYAKKAYSANIREQLLPLLSDLGNWGLLVQELKQLFQLDAEFNEIIFRKQMAILRGQLHNIVEALKAGESPWELIHRPLLLIEEQETPMTEEVSEDAETGHPNSNSTKGKKKRQRHRHTPVEPNPLCACW